jgi:hypothetical protein
MDALLRPVHSSNFHYFMGLRVSADQFLVQNDANSDLQARPGAEVALPDIRVTSLPTWTIILELSRI